MNCPNCRHGNPNEARFCAQCGAPLTQPAPVMPATQPTTAPAAQPSRRRHTGLIALAVVVLLVAFGGYAILQRAAGKVATPTAAAARDAARPNDSDGNAAAAPPRAQARGAARGGSAGGGATGAPDQAKAPDNPAQPGPQSEPHDKSSGSGGTADAADTGQASSPISGLLGALSTAVGGVHRHDPVEFHTLEALLPSSLPGLQGAVPGGKADDTMSIKTTSAHVAFAGPNGARIRLSITDATAISGLAGLANMANSDSSEQGDSYEKNETIDGRSVHEKWDATARHGELSLSVGQRFAVDVVGDNVEMDALKNALAHIDLAKLESMKDANPMTK
jgi:zinc ribbon protein